MHMHGLEVISTIYFFYNTKFKTKDITPGVAQGSLLGPLIYIIYVNFVSMASDVLFLILFSDDTSVFLGHSFNGVKNH